MKNCYVLVFDMDQGIDFSALHKSLEESHPAETWWHYIKSLYILITSQSLSDLAGEIHAAFPTLKFLAMKIDIDGADGYLPAKAWDWLDGYVKNQKETASKIDLIFDAMISALSRELQNLTETVDSLKTGDEAVDRKESNQMDKLSVISEKRA